MTLAPHLSPYPQGVMVVLTDPRETDHPIVWVSDSFCAFTGYARGEVIGRSHWSLVTGGPEAPGARRLREAVRTGRSAHALLKGRKKDGTEFYDEVTVHTIRENPADAASPIRYAFGIHLDVMARPDVAPEATARETETRLRSAREQLARVLHDGVSHEFARAGFAHAPVEARRYHDRTGGLSSWHPAKYLGPPQP